MNQQQTQNQSFDQDLKTYEQMCQTLYGPNQSQQAKSAADEQLKQFSENTENVPKLKYILENSQSVYAQYLSASALKNLFSVHWNKISVQEKVAIKSYLIEFLAKKTNNCEQ